MLEILINCHILLKYLNYRLLTSLTTNVERKYSDKIFSSIIYR